MQKIVLNIALVAVLFAMPSILPLSAELGDYRVDIGLHHAVLIALFVTMSMGLNLSIGFAGLLDLGFIAFVAFGAYTMAIFLTLQPQVPWWAAIPICILISVSLRVALGATCLRLRGDYLAIVTLGFGEITRVVLKNDLFGLTGGPDGIFMKHSAIPELFTASEDTLYYVSLCVALLSVFTLYRWRDSRSGRAWEAVREDEIAAQACGINVFKVRIQAYALGGIFAGSAGALYAINNMTAHPTDYEFVESVKVVVMVVLGGMGSVGGVAAGSILFILLLEVFRDLAEYRVLIFGAALVALMVWRPQGLAGRKRA